MASVSLTNTNISDTYVGVLHAKGEAIPASGLQDVYDGFGNKSSLKIGRTGEGIDVDGNLGVNFINSIYPIGSVIFSTDNTNPESRFPDTTWEQVAEGKFIAGVGPGTDKNANTHTVDEGDDTTIGEYTHQLIESELPSHSHGGVMKYPQVAGTELTEQNQRGGPEDFSSYNTSTNTAGGDQPHNNIPPAFGLYVWKRTS